MYMYIYILYIYIIYIYIYIYIVIYISYKLSGRPVISNCGTPTEKVSGFLDRHLQPIMKQGESYIRDTRDFLAKVKASGEVAKEAILVTADVVGLIPTSHIVKVWASLKNNMKIILIKKYLQKI